MFSRMSITKSTENCSDSIKKLQDALCSSDTVVIGAGAGLSVSAGFTYSGKRFIENFSDFISAYNITDMYSGGFYAFKDLEEYWAWWSRQIYLNRYTDAPKPVYNMLFELIADKDYFVITTNVDHQFQCAGFDKKRLFYTQGDYGLFQCSAPCRKETFDNEGIILQMVKRQKNMRVPSELLPVCPYCGRPMITNLRSDSTFVEDEGWNLAAERYESFLRTRKEQHVLFLELGVGYNTPGIIKYPFWHMTEANPKAVYACINYGEASCPKEIAERSIVINADIGEVVSALLDEADCSDKL